MNFPGLDQIRELPVQLTMTIPPEWEDRNGHVNVQVYLALYELGGWVVLEEVTSVSTACTLLLMRPVAAWPPRWSTLRPV
jgi:hypothetical protein